MTFQNLYKVCSLVKKAELYFENYCHQIKDEKNPKNNDGLTPFDFASYVDKKLMYEVMISKNIVLEKEASVLRVIDEKPVNEKRKGFLHSIKDFFQMK